jgi:hypothetical protein
MGIAIDKFDLLEVVRAEYNIVFPILKTSSGRGLSVVPLHASPVLVLFSPNGRYGGMWHGALSDTIKAEVQTKLASTCDDRQSRMGDN